MRCARCNHVNPGDACFCAQCGARLPATAAAQPHSDEEGERRQVTIVFSDLSGYTSLNERVDPEEVEELMVRIRQAANTIVGRHGGTLNQFVGDEVVALFGLPVARRDDAERAVRAARELHDAVLVIGQELSARTGTVLTMHTGINTGTIVTRRSDTRHGHYATTGDAVNTGARLLKLAGTDEIVVGQSTWRQVSGAFDAEACAPVEVKGKQRPVVAYRIRGERRAGPPLRPLAGRAEEIRRIEALARACADARRGRVLVVSGDAGIGKSRLLQEAVTCASHMGLACHRSQVLDFVERGRGAIATLVRSLLDVAPDADTAAVHAAIADAMEHGLSPRDHFVFLCELLDVEPPAELRGLQAALDEDSRNRGSLAALRELARRAAALGPLLLVVEDLHLADAWTLERIGAIAALAPTQPLLLAMTARPDSDPSARAWGATLPGLERIELGPLSEAAALELASSFSEVAATVARSLVERAEGNPLFLEQLLLNAGETAQSSVPGSIQGLVLARLDRLPAADRRAVQAAAVLGQRFGLDALRHLLGTAAYDCAALIDHALVRRDATDVLFCHALIRDGAYESVLKSRRRELHASAGDWFAARDPALAAGHYERAGHAAAPRAYLAAAGAEAGRYHYAVALALAERGLALAATREERFALAAMRSQLLNDSGHPRGSIEAWRATLAVAEGPAERSRALIGLAAGMRVVDQVDDGLAHLAEAEPLARAAERPLELSRIHHLRGNLYFARGRLDDCLREHEAALVQARAAGSAESEALALGGLADAHYLAGRMRSAHRGFSRCVDLCRAHGFGRLEVATLYMVGVSGSYLLPVTQALISVEQCVELAARVAHHRAELLARSQAGYFRGWLLGETGPAAEQLEAARRLAQELGSRRFEGMIGTFQALADLRDGNRARALKRAREALDTCRVHGRHFNAAAACGVLARVATDRAEADAACAEGAALLAKGCISHNHFVYYPLVTEMALERGDWPHVERCCEALARFTAAEPLPMCDLYIARARALVRHRRGERGPALATALGALRAEAARLDIRLMLPALDAALMRS